MPEEGLTIKVEGLDELMAKFDQFPKVITRNLAAAGKQAASRVILPTEGLKNYPPMTDANRPPTPYYVRSLGMQYKSGNTGGSENLGKQWTVRSQHGRTDIGNRASYARWVHGQEQARHMARIGWKKLFDTAKGLIGRITKVYQAWVDKTIRDLKL
jgi:hypothetical protein